MSVARLASDLGGTQTGVPVPWEERPLADWERLLDGLRVGLLAKGMWRHDEIRRATEDLGPECYVQLGYFERRLRATEAVLVERGLLDPAEVGRPRDELPALSVAGRPARNPPAPVAVAPVAPAAFAPGARVQVRDLARTGHVRTPMYVRGKRGRVTGVHGPYPDPERLAYGKTGAPAVWLYGVAFAQREVWQGYEGGADDRLVVDVYEPWLAAEEDR